MQKFVFEREKMFAQFEKIYQTYPTDMSALYRILDQRETEHPDASAFEKKAWIYETAAEHCTVHLMPACPFYMELDTGRDRNSITSTWPPEPGLADWLMAKHTELLAEYNEGWLPHFVDTQMIGGVMFADFAHHYANVESVLQYGFSGLREQAQAKLQEVSAREEHSEHTLAYYRSMITALDAVMRIADRFALKAEEMLLQEQDIQARVHLQQIAKTAGRVPRYPAQTFYEALCTICFVREMCNALEGMGFAVYGHIDRILEPYYVRDIQNGEIIKEEAQALIDCFMAITDARWDLSRELPGGTNATVIIGGCDAAGKLVYNEVTEMLIASMERHHFANPKLQARVQPGHPKIYLEQLAALAKTGTNVLSIFNDEVIIRSQVKAGKKEEDARLYLAGGCQEPTLSCELNSRAYIYLNLANMMDVSLFPETWSKVFQAAGEEVNFMPAYQARDFDTFYRRCMYNFGVQIQLFVNRYNHLARKWPQVNPCPLYSAMMEDCIQNEMDVTEGGARYNSDSFGMTGLGTVVDSLFAIKKAVYEQKYLSMEALRRALKNNFEGEESLRQYLRNRVPKMGQPDAEMREFTAQCMQDISRQINGYPNTRGGYFEASLFTFYSFEWFREAKANASGRKQGDYLSRGGNPSEYAGGIDAATLLHAQSAVDYTEYPGGGVLYMDLPVTKGPLGDALFVSVIQNFLQNGGSIMDFNVIDRAQLLEAQKDPENHQNIVVRICGYSALFHTLDKVMQDEIIGRTQR